MNLSGNEFKVYSYLLDKFQNVLDKYNNNIDISKVYHAESQISISEKLHMSCRTLQNVLNSLCEKKMISISCGKEFGEKNAYYMTDITQTDCYKQLDEKYKYEYEVKKKNTTNTRVVSSRAETSSASSKASSKIDNEGCFTVVNDSDKIDYQSLHHVLRNYIMKYYSALNNVDEYKRVISDCTNMTYKNFIEYIKIHYDIDISNLYVFE